MEKENKSFEELLNELEETVKILENKDISLEDAVKNYEKGIELSKKCNDILKANEKLVVQKMTESGLEDFEKED